MKINKILEKLFATIVIFFFLVIGYILCINPQILNIKSTIFDGVIYLPYTLLNKANYAKHIFLMVYGAIIFLCISQLELMWREKEVLIKDIDKIN